MTVAGALMLASLMCSSGGGTTPDAGDAGDDDGGPCELNASAACGAPGGDFAKTTESGCTGSKCPGGQICLQSNGSLTCVSVSAVCGGSAGTVQSILACHDGGVCPAQMLCGSLDTCVPDCAGDGG